MNDRLSRRRLLQGAAATLCATAVPAVLTPAHGRDGRGTQRGRVKQSVAFWCFNSAGEKWDADTTCRIAKDLGCPSVELIGPEHWATLKKHGLICAMASNGMPGAPFMKGLNNARYHEQVLATTQKTIDACAAAGFPNVIAFTGYKWRDADNPQSGAIPRDEATMNCVKGLKQLAGYTEKKNVTICLEHLNTRDTTHPMKGHPGYQGDDLDWVAEIIRAVGSPRVRLLFDIYHVQVMHGDVIRRIEQTKDIIGHVHTAGCPGRGELDDRQEVNYPAVIRKLIEVGYAGYVGQEFIPTRAPREGLREAVKLCDV
jgi:sugar phosphate isomerase/epimerase